MRVLVTGVSSGLGLGLAAGSILDLLPRVRGLESGSFADVRKL